MNFTDNAKIGEIRTTADGYKVAEVPVARTGLQDYAGYEVGRPDMPVVRMYRPPSAVFADDYLKSIAHKPVTDDHPSGGVNSSNWTELAKGYTGDTIRKDEANGLIYVPLLLADQATIDKLDAGKREVSCGYTCDVEWTPGVTPDGEKYDALQIPQSLNHVALVQRGRAGYSCRVGDNWTPVTEDKEPSVALKTVKIASVADGMPFEATDAAETIINKLVADRDTLTNKLADADKARDEAVKAKDTAEGKVVALEKAVEDAAVTPAKLEQLVADRAALVASAKAIVADFDAKGLDEAAIRKAVVTNKLGDKAPTNDAAIEGAFAVLAASVTDADPLRDAIKDNKTVVDGEKRAQSAYDKMVADLEGGYKQKVAA